MELPDVIDVVRPSVVQVNCMVDGLSAEQLARPEIAAEVARSPGVHSIHRIIGTGFFVNDGAFVVTAKHVIDGLRQIAAQFPNAQVRGGLGLAWPNTSNMRSNFFILGFQIIEEDLRHDLALLEAGPNPFAGGVSQGIVINNQPLEPMYAVPNLQPGRPRDGEPIGVSGYPLGESVLVTNVGVVASAWPTSISEMTHPTIPGVTIPQIDDIYLGDVQSNPGNSGGPTYSAVDGSIIGVLVAGKLAPAVVGGRPAVLGGAVVSADAGLSVIVPARYVVEMLDRNNVGWTAAT